MSAKFDKSVTVKFTQDDFLTIADEAERSGTTIAHVVRESCLHYRKLKQVEEQLVAMERRQQKVLFEVLSAALNLSLKKKQSIIAILDSNGVRI
jgi:predicted transcriptional regulator